jgi:hypothetical protein
MAEWLEMKLELYLARRFHRQFLDKNRCDIGKSQSSWTDAKMETARSHEGEDGVAKTPSRNRFVP